MKKSGSFSPKERKCGRSCACLGAVFLLLVSGCAGVERLFEAPFDPQAIAVLAAGLEDQNRRVHSFFSSGRLWMKDLQGQEAEAAIFSAAEKASSRIKIEITHPWGQPVLHLLVDGSVLRLLSFSERKLYFGEFTSEALSRFFPEVIDRTLIWDFLRAYPTLEAPYRAFSNEPNQISITNEGGVEKKIIKFEGENLRPAEVIVPRQNIRVAFSDFRADESYLYAAETALVHVVGGKRIIHRIEKMVFNKTIPDQVFTLQAPPGFETAPLKEE